MTLIPVKDRYPLRIWTVGGLTLRPVSGRDTMLFPKVFTGRSDLIEGVFLRIIILYIVNFIFSTDS